MSERSRWVLAWPPASTWRLAEQYLGEQLQLVQKVRYEGLDLGDWGELAAETGIEEEEEGVAGDEEPEHHQASQQEGGLKLEEVRSCPAE